MKDEEIINALKLLEDNKKLFGEAFHSLKNPSEKVQLFALKYDGTLVRYIKNPDEKIQMFALESDINAFKYIKNPCKKVQLKAVKYDGWFIEKLKKMPVSKDVQIEAVKRTGTAILFIDHPSEDVQMAAVSQNPCVVGYIQNPSIKVKNFVNQLKQNSF